MSKNNIFRNFALMLVALLIIPTASAQIAGISLGNLKYILINTAVIGIVLFILQAFLMPGKTDKEKPAMTMIVIAASLVIAWIYGQTDYIWKSGPLALVFNYYVLGNALVMGVVIYFAFGLLKVNEKLNSKEGSVGYVIIIGLISLFFAVKLGNQWIWDQNTIKQLIGYLFGTDGILNPSPPAYRLWTFIGSFTLLSFFFTGYLMKGGVNSKNTMSYLLALVFATNMASSGISINSVIRLGEIIFVLMLAPVLGESTTKKYGINWLIALFLVGWASLAVTSGTSYSGLFGSILGGVAYPFNNPLKSLGYFAQFVLAIGVLALGGWFAFKGAMGIISKARGGP